MCREYDSPQDQRGAVRSRIGLNRDFEYIVLEYCSRKPLEKLYCCLFGASLLALNCTFWVWGQGLVLQALCLGNFGVRALGL